MYPAAVDERFREVVDTYIREREAPFRTEEFAGASGGVHLPQKKAPLFLDELQAFVIGRQHAVSSAYGGDVGAEDQQDRLLWTLCIVMHDSGTAPAPFPIHDGKTVLIFGNTVTHRRVFEVPQVIFHVLGMWVTKSGDHAGQIGPLCVHPHHAEHNRACIGDVGRLIQFDETHSFIHMFEN